MFTRYHEVGVTKIRSHQTAEPRLCKRILCYEANALLLSTMVREMPCEKEKVVPYTGRDVVAGPGRMTRRLKDGPWFGFAEVAIKIPWHLRIKFEEMCLFVYNKQVPVKVVPQHMLDYLQRTGRKRADGKKLVGALSAGKKLVYAPLLRWYVDHGAVITRVYPSKIFTWFVKQVTEA